MFYWIVKIIFSPIIKLIWVKEVTGLENIPDSGPIIIASNHSSYFDFITLIAICPRKITFLAAEVFFESPLWKPLMIMMEQAKVDRKSKDKSAVFQAAKKVLDSGRIFGIFPEGTRSRTGNIQKAYLGVAKIALDNKVSILPVAICNSFKVMKPQDKFPKFKKIIKVNFLKPINVFDGESPDKIVHSILMPQIANKVGQTYDYK